MKKWKMMVLSVVCVTTGYAQNTSNTAVTLSDLIAHSIEKSNQVKLKQLQTEKAVLDKKKAYNAYLPKVTLEGSYSYLDRDIRLPEDMETLLGATQQLLIKEQVAMKMQSLQIPDAYKVNFATAYTADATNPKAPSSVLAGTLAQNYKDIPPIQERNVWKANLSAQMLLFSGLKVPLSLKAAQHQIIAMNLLTETEKSSVIKDVIQAYDKLAVISESETVLNQSLTMLNQQMFYVNKAIENGLAIDLQRQKVELSLQQLQVKQIELANNKKLLIAKLEELTGYNETDLLLIKPSLEPWMLKDSSISASNRSDIKALDEAIIATKYKQYSELTDYMPKVVAFGKKELYKDDLSVFDPEWVVGVGVKWTLFDGCSATNAARQAKIDKQILETKKNEAEELVGLNLKKLLYEVEKNTDMISVAQQQIKTTEKSVKLSEKQLKEGLTTIREHLLVINDYEQAQLEYIKMLYQQRASVAEYLDAAGLLNAESVK